MIYYIRLLLMLYLCLRGYMAKKYGPKTPKDWKQTFNRLEFEFIKVSG